MATKKITMTATKLRTAEGLLELMARVLEAVLLPYLETMKEQGALTTKDITSLVSCITTTAAQMKSFLNLLEIEDRQRVIEKAFARFLTIKTLLTEEQSKQVIDRIVNEIREGEQE